MAFVTSSDALVTSSDALLHAGRFLHLPLEKGEVSQT